MTTVIVLGAGGKAGTRIVSEALDRGYEVVSVVRDSSQIPTLLSASTRVIEGSASDPDLLGQVLPSADAVIVAVGSMSSAPWLATAKAVVSTIGSLPEQARPYVIHMGGGATLRAPDGRPFFEQDAFPEAFKMPAHGQAEALAWYVDNATVMRVRWTYASPPPVHFEPGIRTGSYRLGRDTPVVREGREAELSYEDFAVALVDEVTRQDQQGHRFTVGY